MFTAVGSPGRIVSFKLSPGDDLMQGIINVCEKAHIQNGAIICAIGSLSNAVVKNVIYIPNVKYEAGYGEPTRFEGPIELTGASGIICHDDNGKLLPHIHITMSDKDAHGFGGHLCEGTTVRITVDGAIMEFDHINMHKVMDQERNIMVFRPEEINK
ncbi:MAG: PPC domain-containing DNA-binding protein [Erysipelotrichaceae bacterium]|nr:PPC domain-containing DNA-binding protein [Erysipelotrichaceae bacterium]